MPMSHTHDIGNYPPDGQVNFVKIFADYANYLYMYNIHVYMYA